MTFLDQKGVSWTLCQRILSEDLLRQISDKMNLVDARQEHLTSWSLTLTWCCGYDPETQAEQPVVGTRCPKKSRQIRSSLNTMLICFFDLAGIIHREFVPLGRTEEQGIVEERRNTTRHLSTGLFV